jgi:hypothetical protein
MNVFVFAVFVVVSDFYMCLRFSPFKFKYTFVKIIIIAYDENHCQIDCVLCQNEIANKVNSERCGIICNTVLRWQTNNAMSKFQKVKQWQMRFKQ